MYMYVAESLIGSVNMPIECRGEILIITSVVQWAFYIFFFFLYSLGGTHTGSSSGTGVEGGLGTSAGLALREGKVHLHSTGAYRK